MKPRVLLGSGTAPDGSLLTLHEEASGHVVRIGNEVLMSSRAHGSEQAMAVHGLVAALRAERPRVLVSGLGMGFTLRAALDVLPRRSEVVVAELFPCVVEWCRGVLAPLSHEALSDPRVRVEVADVQDVVRRDREGFDSILLDVDNGPDALVTLGNAEIYSPRGLAAMRAALRPGGTLCVWSASGSKAFEKALARAGFLVETQKVDARQDAGRGGRHTLFLAHAAPGARHTAQPSTTLPGPRPPRRSGRRPRGGRR